MKRYRFPHLRIVFKALPKDWGYTYPNEWTIYLDKRMEDKLMIDTAAHEVLHKIIPDLKEETVELAGQHIADVLTRIGFARNQDDT